MAVNKAKYAPSTSFDHYDENGNLTVPAEWRADEISGTMFPLAAARDRSENSKQVQQEFAAYFVDEWQYGKV